NGTGEGLLSDARSASRACPLRRGPAGPFGPACDSRLPGREMQPQRLAQPAFHPSGPGLPHTPLNRPLFCFLLGPQPPKDAPSLEGVSVPRGEGPESPPPDGRSLWPPITSP